MWKDVRGCPFCELICGTLDAFFDGWEEGARLLARAIITVLLHAIWPMVVSALRLTEKDDLFYNYLYIEIDGDEGEHWSA